MDALRKLSVLNNEFVQSIIQIALGLAQDLNSQVLTTSHIFLVLLALAEALRRPWYIKLAISSDDIYKQLLKDGHTSIKAMNIPSGLKIMSFRIKHLVNYLTKEFSRCKRNKDRFEHFVLACLVIMLLEERLTYEWIVDIREGITEYITS